MWLDADDEDDKLAMELALPAPQLPPLPAPWNIAPASSSSIIIGMLGSVA